jgi:hypothetical protein
VGVSLRDPVSRSAAAVDMQLRTLGPAFVDEQHCLAAVPIVVRSGHAPSHEPRDRFAPEGFTRLGDDDVTALKQEE